MTDKLEPDLRDTPRVNQWEGKPSDYFERSTILRVIDEDVADLIAVSMGLDPTSEEWRQVQARIATATRLRARFEEGDETEPSTP